MLHPLLVPAHVLAILGLGLLFGQKAPTSSRLAMPAFALALVAASAVPPAIAAPLPQAMLLSLVLAAGLLVALSLDLGAILPGLIGAATGVLIGLDAGHSVLADGQSWLALAGMATGAILAVALLGGLAARLGGFWLGIPVRVLGSWTAASAFLVIALSFAATGGDG
jgi:urease accessory protein